ncbi:hypothetical protein EUGRSUZ_B02551 [Eucalyptus grandis]|uniref:Uncharacterized protein n=2 Tax=Eucalyptus grandis TaxID=71139 RepID=A0ACC3LU21_EUCGR|nr:hypothetical protein EUGRSUZ_B02551 [Eucalyptus grandis]
MQSNRPLKGIKSQFELRSTYVWDSTGIVGMIGIEATLVGILIRLQKTQHDRASHVLGTAARNLYLA